MTAACSGSRGRTPEDGPLGLFGQFFERALVRVDATVADQPLERHPTEAVGREAGDFHVHVAGHRLSLFQQEGREDRAVDLHRAVGPGEGVSEGRVADRVVHVHLRVRQGQIEEIEDKSVQQQVLVGGHFEAEHEVSDLRRVERFAGERDVADGEGLDLLDRLLLHLHGGAGLVDEGLVTLVAGREGEAQDEEENDVKGVSHDMSFAVCRYGSLECSICVLNEKGRSESDFSADLDGPFSFAAVCQWSIQKDWTLFVMYIIHLYDKMSSKSDTSNKAIQKA